MRNLRGKCGYCAAAEASLASFASCSDRLHESSPPVPAVEFLSGPDTNQQAPGLLWPHRSAGVPAEVIVAFGISPAVATPSSTGFECQAYLEAIELTPLAEARSAGGFFIVYSSDRFLRCPKRCRQCSLARPWATLRSTAKVVFGFLARCIQPLRRCCPGRSWAMNSGRQPGSVYTFVQCGPPHQMLRDVRGAGVQAKDF